MMNNNMLMQLVRLVKSGGNPMEMLSSMAGVNPQIAQALSMMNGKNEGQLKTIALNMAKEQGIDLNDLANQLGLQLPS